MAKIWFKRRRWGWGWVPSTWQGWTVLLGYIAALLVAGVVLAERNVAGFLGVVVALTAILVAITSATGPSPKWRWGAGPDDDPELDA